MLIPPSWLTAWKLLPFSVSSMFQKALRELGPRALTYLLLPTESKPCVNYGSTEGNLSVGAEQAMAELETDLKGGIVHSDRFFLPPPAAGLVPAFHLRLTFTQQLLAQCENCSEVLNHSSFVLQLFSRTFYVSCGLYTCKLGACQGSLTDVLLCLFSNIWRGKWQEMQILTFPYFKRQVPPFSVSTCSPSWYLFYTFFCKTVMGVSISTQRVSLSVTFFLLLLCLLTTICNFLSEYPLADRRYITVQPSPHDLGINASLNAWPTHKELIVSLIIYSQQSPTVAASSSHTRSPNKGKIIKPSLLCDYGLKDSTAIPKTS